MNKDKCSEAIQEGVTYFSTGGTTAIFVLGIIGMIVGIPVGATAAVVGLSALLFGALGVWRAVRRHNKQKIAEGQNAEVNLSVEERKQHDLMEEKGRSDVIILLRQINDTLHDNKLEEVKHSDPVVFELINDESEEINADDFFLSHDKSSFLNKSHFFAERPQAVNDESFQSKTKESSKCVV